MTLYILNAFQDALSYCDNIPLTNNSIQLLIAEKNILHNILNGEIQLEDKSMISFFFFRYHFISKMIDNYNYNILFDDIINI